MFLIKFLISPQPIKIPILSILCHKGTNFEVVLIANVEAMY